MSASAQVYTTALVNGLAQQDTASVCEVLEEMADYKRVNKIGRRRLVLLACLGM